jgi:hypothetical protein
MLGECYCSPRADRSEPARGLFAGSADAVCARAAVVEVTWISPAKLSFGSAAKGLRVTIHECLEKFSEGRNTNVGPRPFNATLRSNCSLYPNHGIRMFIHCHEAPSDRWRSALLKFMNVGPFCRSILAGNLPAAGAERPCKVNRLPLGDRQRQAVAQILAHTLAVVQWPPKTGTATYSALHARTLADAGNKATIVARRDLACDHLVRTVRRCRPGIAPVTLVRVVGELFRGRSPKSGHSAPA